MAIKLKVGMLVLCHFFYGNDPNLKKEDSVQEADITTKADSSKPVQIVGTIKGIYKVKEYKTAKVNGKLFAFDEYKKILDVESKRQNIRVYINSNACVSVGSKAEYQAELIRAEKEKIELEILKEQSQQEPTNDVENQEIKENVEQNKILNNQEIKEESKNQIKQTENEEINNKKEEHKENSEKHENKIDNTLKEEKKEPEVKVEKKTVYKEILKDILSK